MSYLRCTTLNCTIESIICISLAHISVSCSCGAVRLDELKAVHFRNDRLLLSAWTALLGYIIALRTERYRREHRLTAVATAHYR